MSLATGDDFVSGDILSYQQANRMKNHFRGASVPGDIQPGMCHSDSDDDKYYHRGASATEEMLQLTRSKDTEPAFTGLNIVCMGGEVVTLDGEVIFLVP